MTGGQQPSRRRNHATWIGVVVTFVGFVSYFTFFSRFADLRDFPWVNLPLVLCGVGISAFAVARAFRRGLRRRSKALAISGLLFSTMLAAALGLYVFSLSYTLPGPEGALAVGAPVPDLTLHDHTGAAVRLVDLRGTKAVLVFYRGHW